MVNGETTRDTARVFLRIIEINGSIEANSLTIRSTALANIVGQAATLTRDGSATRANPVSVVTSGAPTEVSTVC